MEVLYSSQPKELKANLQVMENSVDVKSVLILMTNDPLFSDELICKSLNSFKKPIIGGKFYELIFNSKCQKSGVLLIPLPFLLNTSIYDFDKGGVNVFDALEELYSETLPDKGSVFVFADAFTTSKNQFIEDLFNFFGFRFKFVGAGCGSDSFESMPCVIHNSGVFQNAGVIGFTDTDITLGIAHGWTSITQPLKVTESELNKVISINWEPAFECYKNIVEKHSGQTFNDQNFLDIVKSYPIGLVKIDGEMVIRDPFMTRDGALFCLDNIDKGQYITIMNGNIDSLVDGAGKASKSCCNSIDIDHDKSQFVFCIDCISRVLFLGDQYALELQAIGGNLPVNGASSFGEIANVGHSFLEIYNKTVIVSRWEQTF
jgi:hypothetical protein